MRQQRRKDEARGEGERRMKGGEVFIGDRESDTGQDEKKRRGGNWRGRAEEVEEVWEERCEKTGRVERTERWKHEE